jgi:hypothetical protein
MFTVVHGARGQLVYPIFRPIQTRRQEPRPSQQFGLRIGFNWQGSTKNRMRGSLALSTKVPGARATFLEDEANAKG